MSTSTLDQTSAAHIKAAIHQVTAGIRQDPESAKTVFEARAVLNNGLRTDVFIRDHFQIQDEPESLGGQDQGPNPVEVVLGALASCQEIVLAAYAAALDIPIEEIRVQAKGQLDLRGFFNLGKVRAGFESVQFQITIRTSETDASKLEKLKHFALNNCPVLDILQQPIPVEGSFSFENAQ